MTLTLALQCDVQRLHPHETNGDLVLGLNLQIAFRRRTALTLADVAWAQNWLWDELRLVDVYFFPKDTTKPGVLREKKDVWDLNPKPGVPTQSQRALTDRVEALFKAGGDASFTWEPTNPNGPLPQQGHVTSIQSAAARLATSPGYSLNLCAVVRIKNADIPPGVSAAGKLDEDSLVFAVPRLNRKTGTFQYVPNKDGPGKIDPASGGPKMVAATGKPERPTGREMAAWTCDAAINPGPAQTPAMIAYVKPVDLRTSDSDGRYIVMKTGWVRRFLLDGGAEVPVSDPGEDWSTQLAGRIADRWNLAKHLVDAVRGCVAIPNFVDYWTLIAAALRDRAGLGLIDTTDGNGLLRFAIQLAKPVAGYGESWFDNLARDGALRSLQARMVDGEATMDTNNKPITLKTWLSIINGFSPLPLTLRESFRSDVAPPKAAPQRTITLTWPAKDPGIATVLAGVEPPAATIVVYSRRDGGVTATAAAGVVGAAAAAATAAAGAVGAVGAAAAAAAIAISAGQIARITPVVGKRESHVDGSVSLTFDAYDQLSKKPLPSGWFEAIVDDGAGHTYASARQFVPPTVADDLAPLVRLGTALSDNAVLAPMVFAGWAEQANRTFSVAPGQKSRPWFGTTFTKSDDFTFHWVGDVRPLDGRTWVVTLGNVTLGAAGDSFTIELASEYATTGEPDAGAAALQLKIDRLGAAPNLKMTLSLQGTILSNVGAVDVPGDYHVRIELRRQNESSISASVFVGEKKGAATNWFTGKPIVVLEGLREPKLQRLGLRVCHGAGGAVNATAPTLLTSPRSLMDPEVKDLRTLWDATIDPAKDLWDKATAPDLKTNLQRTLPRLDIVTRLARGQVARLEPIWHKQLPVASPNYRKYLSEKLTFYLSHLADQRFDRAAGAKFASPYRDFYPEVSAPLANELWDLVTARLTAVAAIPLLPLEFHAHAPFGEQPADKIPTPMPHALNLEVDRPGMFADTLKDGDDEDLLVNLRGFGVLFRQANPTAPPDPDPAKYFENQPWQLLTCVDVGVLASPAPPQITLDDYVPDVGFGMLSGDVPLQYQNLSRQTTITFRNRHLAAVSPLTEIAEGFKFGSDQLRAKPSPFMRKMPGKLPASAPIHDWSVLPTLKFGQLYQVFPFVIGNSGNMPVLLTGDKGHPAQLRTSRIADSEFDVVFEGHAAKEYVRSLKYLRRVGIGPVRLESVNGETSKNGKKIGLPDVPEGVRPLTTEWEIQGLSLGQPALRYLYDRGVRKGEIGQDDKPVENWAIVVPRVFVAGSSESEFEGTGIAFDLTIGLQSDATANPSCCLRIERIAQVLRVNGVEVEQLQVPECGALLGGPLDLCLAYATDRGTGKPSLRLAWRRSDRQEPWSSSRKAIVDATAINGLAWVEVKRNDLATPPIEPETTITFATPRFSLGSVDLQAFLVDERLLDLRPLASPDRAVVVLPPPKVEPNVSVTFKPEKTLTFGLRPPATDLETWTAWVDMDRIQGGPDIRLATWTYHKLWSVPVPEGEPENPDATIDDFAVNLLLVELVPLHVDSVPRDDYPHKMETPVRAVWTVARGAAGDDLKAAQSPAQLFEIEVQPVFTASFSDVDLKAEYDKVQRLVSGATIKITIFEREIWELRVYPAVLAEYFSTKSNKPGAQRFHSAFGDGVAWKNGADEYRLFAPWRLVIEGATNEVVTPSVRTPNAKKDLVMSRQLLFESLRPKFSGKLVAVDQSKQHPRNYRYAAQVRLIRQVWRWQGRPVLPFPFDAATPTSQIDVIPATPRDDSPEWETPSSLVFWDAAGFGARSNVDLLEETRPIAADQRTESLFREDLSSDRRALYYRFSLQAVSRYAGLFDSAPTQQAADGDDSKRQNPWRRLVVPCRFNGDVPRPTIRFLVPLTQSEEDDPIAGVPGLLVVLDDAWYSHGGLAESLEAEVVESADFWDTWDPNPKNEKPPQKRPEFSPSPTHTGKGWTTKDVGEGTDDKPPSRSLAMEIVGPIGHTFDTDAEAPLYNASSFMLRPPAVRGVLGMNGKPESLDWYFAKIRFRRVLLPEANADYVLGTLKPIVNDVSVSLELDPARQWVIEAAQASLRHDGMNTAQLTAQLDTLGTMTVSLTARDRLQIEWASTQGMPGSLTYVVEPPESGLPSQVAVLVDLRFLLQLDARAGSTTGTSGPPRHLTVQIRVRSLANGDPAKPGRLATKQSQRTWCTVAALTWDALKWPGVLTLKARGDVSSSPTAVFPACVSPFTAPLWVQFLPDSELLRGLLRKILDGASSEGKPKLVWGSASPKATWILRHENGEDLTPLLPTSALVPTAPKSNIVRFRCVLLTELIADVRGQFGQELYLGLFKRTRDGLNMEEIHRSVNAAKEFWRADSAPRKLRIRALEFEMVGTPNVESEPWNLLFKNPDSATNEDAVARIARPSPPVEVVEQLPET